MTIFVPFNLFQVLWQNNVTSFLKKNGNNKKLSDMLKTP